MVSVSGQVELARSEPKLWLIGMKRMRRIFTRGIAAFAGAHEKIVRKNNEVHDSLPGLRGVRIRNN
jgi:hypothetical protein